MKKLLFYLLGVLSALLLTPVLVFVLTLGVPSFEGGRGFAFIYIMPFIFAGLMVLFGIEQWVLKKKVKAYHKKRNVFSGIVILLVGIGFVIMTIRRVNYCYLQIEMAKNGKCLSLAINDYLI